MAHKIGSWFVSPAGRKFMFGVASTTSIGICCLYALPNTFFLNKYKEVVHLYKHGMPAKLPQSSLDIFNKAMDLLEIEELHRKLVNPFSVIGFEVFHAGSMQSRFGGIVGIPINFTYNSVQDIEKGDIVVMGEPVNWEEPAAQELLKCLVLSEEAKLFAVAREILSLNTFKLLLDTFYASSAFVFVYGLSSNINLKYNLYKKPFALRGCLYTIISFFGFGIYSLLTDMTQHYYDRKVDQELSERGEVFVKGGKDFYSHVLTRNKTLRKLMGRFGESQYTALGNEYFLLRQKRLPLLDRRNFFINKLSNLQKNTQEDIL